MATFFRNTEKGNAYMLPNAYKKTLIGINRDLIVWVEGMHKIIGFNPSKFGIAGGPIGTNNGLEFTKFQLLQIVKSMPNGAVLKVASGGLVVNKSDKIASNDLTIDESFKKDNDMVQIGVNSFAPSSKIKDKTFKKFNLRKWLQTY